MITCLSKKYLAGKIVDNWESTPEEIKAAREVLSEKMCFSCRNPMVRDLGLDDVLCEKKK